MEHENHDKWEQSLETVKEKWTEFTDGIFLAIREEELRIRREELERHDDARSQHCAPLNLPHTQGGWNGRP
jgi:hypothetical protein